MWLTGGHSDICDGPPASISPCVCMCVCQEGFKTPILSQQEILTLSVLHTSHTNIPPPDCPYAIPLLHFFAYLFLCVVKFILKLCFYFVFPVAYIMCDYSIAHFSTEECMDRLAGCLFDALFDPKICRMFKPPRLEVKADSNAHMKTNIHTNCGVQKSFSFCVQSSHCW